MISKNTVLLINKGMRDYVQIKQHAQFHPDIELKEDFDQIPSMPDKQIGQIIDSSHSVSWNKP